MRFITGYHREVLCHLARHGESLLNAHGAGGVDCDLTALGQAQSERLADRLAPARPRAIYASPYARAIQTALPLARRLGLPIRLRYELCEFHHTVSDALLGFQPPSPDELAARYPDAAIDAESPINAAWPPINESREGVATRLRRFADEMKARWTAREDVIVCISHGSPIARMIDGWLSDSAGPAFRFIIDNAALSSLRYLAGVRSLVCLNETSHLIDLPRPALSNFDANGLARPEPPTPYW